MTNSVNGDIAAKILSEKMFELMPVKGFKDESERYKLAYPDHECDEEIKALARELFKAKVNVNIPDASLADKCLVAARSFTMACTDFFED